MGTQPPSRPHCSRLHHLATSAAVRRVSEMLVLELMASLTEQQTSTQCLALVESAAVAKGGCSSKRHGDSETRGVTCHSRRGRHPSLPGFCATPSWAGTLARSTVTSTVARLHNLQRCAADHPATIRHPVYARYPLLPCDINLYCLCCPHHCPLAALLSQSFTFYSHFAHPCDALTSCATGPSFWNDEGVVECEPGDYFPTCKQPRAL